MPATALIAPFASGILLLPASAGVTLAQAGGLFGEAAPPPALPGPPFLEAHLFESPWTTAIALVAAGVVAWFMLRHTRPGLALILPLALGALAAGNVVLSFAVTTERERLEMATVALVDAVARADGAAVDAALLDQATLTVLGQPSNRAKPEIVRQVNTDMLGRFALTNRHATTSRLSAALDGANVARTQFRVQAVAAAANLPVGMWWTIHWRLEKDRWRAVALELAAFDGLSPGARVPE
ncbi:MAG: hypothetical protein ACT4PL_10245 [Phycisphaerales bacterium]